MDVNAWQRQLFANVFLFFVLAYTMKRRFFFNDNKYIHTGGGVKTCERPKEKVHMGLSVRYIYSIFTALHCLCFTGISSKVTTTTTTQTNLQFQDKAVKILKNIVYK